MIALLLALGCGEPAEEAPPAPEYALDAPSYRFCHEPGFQANEARVWCDLLDDVPPERCPGLHETCANPELAEVSSGCAAGAPGFGGGNRPAPGPAEPPAMPAACDLPDDAAASASTLLRWFGAFTVAAIVLVLLRLLLRYFGRGEQAPARVVVVDAPEEQDDALPDVPDLPSADLLGRARAALEAGDHGEAALLARGAALRRLGEAGRLRLHRARTDREYVRQLRGEVELVEPLRAIVRAVELHRFGGRPLGADGARAALVAAERILGAVVVLLAALALPGSAHGQGFGRHGPFGDAALYDLFSDRGYEVRWLDVPLAEIDADTDAVVLDLAGLDPTPDDWAALRTWVEEGGVLMVAGDATPGFPELGGTGVLARSAPTRLADELGPYLPTPVWPEGVDVVWTGEGGTPWLYAVGEPVSDPTAGTIVLEEGELAPTIVALDLGHGAVLAIADGLLLSNGALVHPANEAFLGEALHVGQGPLGWPLPTPIRVALATTAAVDDSAPPAPAANPRLIPFVLQLALTWALLGLWKGWPFGVPRDPPGEGRLRFADHVGALATRWMRLGATGWALRAVARLWLHRLGPGGLELAARRAGYDAEAARRYVAEIEAVADGPGDGRDPADLERLEELWRVTSRR